MVLAHLCKEKGPIIPECNRCLLHRSHRWCS